MPSLGATFGRGAATTTQWDVANSDCIVIMGSNMAESHPVAFRFVLQAKEKNAATVIHIDPRFTRTSALADVYAPVRPGSDIAFVGGLINYVLEHDRWFKEYVLNYTNVSTIIEDDYAGPEDLGGLFSGWDADNADYASQSWQYRDLDVPATIAEHYSHESSDPGERKRKAHKLTQQPPPRDPTLQHSRCVYQILRRHYAEYSPDMVEKVTGCPRETFLKIADTICKNSGPDRTTVWCYAVGWTHHTTGVQMIRSAAILQTLLGNIGRPGGGVLALRGHASIQGSTDIPTLYNLLPGYLTQPNARKPHKHLKEYLEAESSPTGWWHNTPKYVVSLMRAWYGDTVDPDGEWNYQFVPKIMGDHSQEPMMLAIRDGTIRGLLLVGQNPVVGGHNSHLIRKALPNLEWMVVREIFENETASYWYRSPEVASGDLRPQDIRTEMFLMPAALAAEKEGTVTNTHRLVQWHDKVVEPRGDCRSDSWFFYHLGKRLKELYADSLDPKDEPIRALTWDYSTSGPHQEPSVAEVLKEINGYTWPEREQIADFKDLKDDGTTASGCWIYTGVYPRNDHNQARARRADPPGGPGSHLGWGFTWPTNRRIMYNRASADPSGKPWSERKKWMFWDPQGGPQHTGAWVGPDTPDFSIEKPPDYEPDWSSGPQFGVDAHDGRSPFMMSADGKAWLFAPSGLADGPLPTHYEPVESPVHNPMYAQQNNPAVKKWEQPDNTYHAVDDPSFPYVITTYRLTEHHSGGIPTRMVATTAELQPECFLELSPELAAELRIETLDWVTVSTARGEVEAKALVTERVRPLQIAGRSVHHVGMPWHFGWHGYATGDVVNTLAAIVGDPNSSIHEGKAFTCNVRKGRLTRGSTGVGRVVSSAGEP